MTTKKVDINELIKQSLFQESDESIEEIVGGPMGDVALRGGAVEKPLVTKQLLDIVKDKYNYTVQQAKKWIEDNPKLAAGLAVGTAGAGALGAGAAALRRRRAQR
jgi:hypothetical protein